MAFITLNGTRYQFTELVKQPKSPTMFYRRGTPSATRTLDVGWFAAPQFARDVLGYAEVLTADSQSQMPGNRKYISRKTPWAYPLTNSSGRKFLYASSMSIDPLGDGPTKVAVGPTLDNAQVEEIAFYDTARVGIQFETRTYEILSDAQMLTATQYIAGSLVTLNYDESNLVRYVTKLPKPQGELLTLDSGAYYYVGVQNANGDAIPIYRGTSKNIVQFNLALTWHDIPLTAVPSEMFNPHCTNPSIERSLGKVNHDTFAGFDVGTLMLNAVEIVPDVSAIGDRVYDITYMIEIFNPKQTLPPRLRKKAEEDKGDDFNGRQPGHNHVYQPFDKGGLSPGWYEVVNNGTIIAGAPGPASNLFEQATNVSIYDYCDFRRLFYPASWDIS